MGAQRPTLGDVFAIRLDAERVCLGQVVAEYRRHSYYFAVFDGTYVAGDTPVEDAVLKPIVLLALSFDAKVFNGDWPVIDRAAVRSDIPFPAYKEAIGTPDAIYVVDYSGQLSRRASQTEAEALPYRAFVAPAVLEKAVRALHGLEPWHEAFQRLRPAAELTTARLFEIG